VPCSPKPTLDCSTKEVAQTRPRVLRERTHTKAGGPGAAARAPRLHAADGAARQPQGLVRSSRCPRRTLNLREGRGVSD